MNARAVAALVAVTVAAPSSDRHHRDVTARAARVSDGPVRSGFSVAFKDEVTAYSHNFVTVLPGDSVPFAIAEGTGDGDYALTVTAGTVRQEATARWWWRSPARPGSSTIVVTRGASPDTIRFATFVLVPRERVAGGFLNGYRIGAYPDQPLRGLEIYEKPEGFIEVTRANQNTVVSPHFRLRDFVAKQQGDFPKYVVLQERLLLKLEYLLEAVNEAGYAAESFYIMSGYRTPFYNRAIGNVRYSRHMWGAAADLFIDEHPRDGRMDDLNRDGRVDVRDAQVLIDIVDDQLDDPAYAGFVGGLGRYRANARHGPFVHVDIRDRRARW